MLLVLMHELLVRCILLVEVQVVLLTQLVDPLVDAVGLLQSRIDCVLN